MLFSAARRVLLTSAGTRTAAAAGAGAAAAASTKSCSPNDSVTAAAAAVLSAAAASLPVGSVAVEAPNAIERGLSADIEDLHTRAVATGLDTYTDPRTGFSVFTRLSHLRKGACCGCRCRHCPYGHINVAKRAASTTNNASADKGTTATPPPPPPHSVVYTKGGDKGTSALYTGERRRKTDVVFEALGALDELSSHIGVVRALLRPSPSSSSSSSSNAVPPHTQELLALLEDMQQQLLNAGTVVATPVADATAVDPALVALVNSYTFPAKTKEMEAAIDAIDARLTPLRLFILPGGGNVTSAQLHVARTVCRRAERRMIEVKETHGAAYTDHLRQVNVYVNRMSDFLFVASRSVAEEDIVRKYDDEKQQPPQQ